eukprot:1154378-Pelagomonas_calceolata.AAC.4
MLACGSATCEPEAVLHPLRQKLLHLWDLPIWSELQKKGCKHLLKGACTHTANAAIAAAPHCLQDPPMILGWPH